jgi:hypothetical protein
LARATKLSTGISSARAVSTMPTASSTGDGSGMSALRLWRSIFRRWPNAARVTASSAPARQGRGAARGTSRTTLDVTLGGGTKAEGATSNRIDASVRQPHSTPSRP